MVLVIFGACNGQRPTPRARQPETKIWYMMAGTLEKDSIVKKGYKLPRAPMTNSDLTRLINSDEIQSIVRAPKQQKRGRPLKKNPLKNLGALLKLNPYAKTARRQQLLSQVPTQHPHEEARD
jgi:hypothetical protein